MLLTIFLYCFVYPVALLLLVAALALLKLHLTMPALPNADKCHIVPVTDVMTRMLGEIWTLASAEPGPVHLQWMHDAMAKKKSSFAYMFLAGVTMFEPFDLEDVHFLMLGEGQQAVVKHPDYESLEVVLGPMNLVTLRDEKIHTQQRKQIQPAFAPRALNGIAKNVIPKHGAVLNSDLNEYITKNPQKEGGNGKTEQHKSALVKVRSFFDKATLSIVAEAAFKQIDVRGIKVDQLFAKLSSALSDVSLTMLLPIWLQNLLPTKKNTTAAATVPQINKACEIIAEQCRRDSAGKSEDEMEQLFDSGNATIIDYLVREKSLSQTVMNSHSLSLLLAGHETTEKFFSWATFHLACHPRVQEKLLDELSDAVALNAMPHGLEDIKDCRYLECVVREVFRLSPPVPIVGREVTRDLTLPSGVTLPKKTRLAITPYILHRLPSVYGNDVDAFRPERWEEPKLKEKMKDRVHSLAWMPFLVGKRNCIGKEFAWNEIIMLMSMLVRSFKFALPEGYDPQKTREDWAITMRPVLEVEVVIAPREE